MSFPRYPEYKDSGVEWLGEVPAHWETEPIRLLARPGSDSFIDGDWIEAPFITDEGIRLLQTGNIGVGEYKEQGFRFISEQTFIDLRCTQINPGDVLICRLAEPVGRACLAPDLGVRMITSVDVCILKPRSDLNVRFIVYLLSSAQYLGFMEGQCRGGTRDRVSRSFLGRVRVALPPSAEQDTIASFLDRETAKIDALIAEQERLIDLLKEKRQAVISHAVTKGLDPNVPMKDSGVEWLGEVPAHWEVVRIKHFLRSIDQGWSPQCESYPAESPEEWGVLKVGCVNGGRFDPMENKALPADLNAEPELGIAAGDLLVSRANTRDLVGSAAVSRSDHPNLLLCDKLYRLRLDLGRCSPQFLALYLGLPIARGQIENAATGASSSMLNISQSTILELQVALPPLSEQATIEMTIDASAGRLDALMADTVAAAALLRDRRAALISAAVTGQIDVRIVDPTARTLSMDPYDEAG